MMDAAKRYYVALTLSVCVAFLIVYSLGEADLLGSCFEGACGYMGAFIVAPFITLILLFPAAAYFRHFPRATLPVGSVCSLLILIPMGLFFVGLAVVSIIVLHRLWGSRLGQALRAHINHTMIAPLAERIRRIKVRAKIARFAEPVANAIQGFETWWITPPAHLAQPPESTHRAQEAAAQSASETPTFVASATISPTSRRHKHRLSFAAIVLCLGSLPFVRDPLGPLAIMIIIPFAFLLGLADLAATWWARRQHAKGFAKKQGQQPSWRWPRAAILIAITAWGTSVYLFESLRRSVPQGIPATSQHSPEALRTTAAYVSLDVVVFSYLDRPIYDVTLNGKWVGVADKYTSRSGGSMSDVDIPSGPQKVSWRLDGPKGTPRNGETVAAKSVTPLDTVPKDAEFLSIHIYPDDTVELIPSVNYPNVSTRGQAILDEHDHGQR